MLGNTKFGAFPRRVQSNEPRVYSLDLGMRLLHAALRHLIRKGTLTLNAPCGRSMRIGLGHPSVVVYVADAETIWRLLLNPDLAVGEAYMDGKLMVENGDIYDFLDLCLGNLGRDHGNWIQRLHYQLSRLWRPLAQYNPIPQARANVAHHYDIASQLYGFFLDDDRQYSCAYFASEDDTLEQAQENKKRHIATKLLLKPGQRVLDIGSGWGGLAAHLARTAQVNVTGITLSTEQLVYAQHQTSDIRDRVQFNLMDYRQVSGRYDRIVSVGMVEHVGVDHFRTYFHRIRDLLVDDGVALIHTIGCANGPGAAHPWISKYIFPGGYVPALSELIPLIERVGLYVTDVEVLRLHYARTLKAWRECFRGRSAEVAGIYDERFCRMWEFYLAGCEAAFRHSGLVVFQIQLGKRIDGVPMTRDYMYAHQNGQDIDVIPTTAMV